MRRALAVLATVVATFVVVPASHAAVGDLTFLDCLGGNGQDYAPECEDPELADTVNNFTDVALSPDGSRLYAVSLRNDSITWFDRDAPTGLLTWGGCITSTVTDEDPPAECENIGGDGDINSGEDYEAALDRADSILVNEDFVYVGGENGGISWYTPTASGLDFAGCLSTYTAPLDREDCATVGAAYVGAFGGLEDMAFTPEGGHLVTAGDSEDAVAFVTLDGNGVPQGVDSCRAAAANPCAAASAAGAEVLEDVVGVEVGTDAFFALGERWSAVGSFARSGAETATAPATCFSFAEAPRDCSAMPHGAFGLVEEDKAILLDPQGDDLYIASQDVEGHVATSTASIVHFNVAPGGALTFVECIAPNVAGCEAPPDGIQLPLDVWRLALSEDGKHLYASDDDDEGVAILSVDPATGDMAWQGCVTSDDDVTTPCARVPAFSLSSPSGMVVSPDDRFLYVAHSEGITTLARETPGAPPPDDGGTTPPPGQDPLPPLPPGTPPSGTPPATTPPSGTPVPRARPVIRGPSRISVRRNKAPVRVSCPGTVRCDGRVAFTFSAGRARAAATVTLGSARFSIPAGKSKKVQVTLSKRGRALLKKRKRLRVRVVVRVTGVAPVARTVTLARG